MKAFEPHSIARAKSQVAEVAEDQLNAIDMQSVFASGFASTVLTRRCIRRCPLGLEPVPGDPDCIFNRLHIEELCSFSHIVDEATVYLDTSDWPLELDS